MARLEDAVICIRRIGFWELTKRVWGQVCEDSLFVYAAALAYSWLFAIFPFFIFLLTLVPYVPEAQKQQVLDGLDQALRSLPNETYNLLHERVQTTVSQVLNESHRGLMSVGILLTLWAASGGMNMTMAALDRAYDIDTNRPFYKQRPMAMLMTLVVTLLVMLILVVLPVGTAVLKTIWDYFQLPWFTYYVLTVGRWMLALLLMVILLNVIYHFGTQIKQHFHLITPGAVFAIICWIVLGTSFRFYVNHIAEGKYNRTYGAVGGVVILLLLFYFDALVLLVGAEINSEIDFELLGVAHGTRDLRIKPLGEPAAKA